MVSQHRLACCLNILELLRKKWFRQLQNYLENKMTIRVAINGYGRIGRNILRAHYEDGKKRDIEIVAINATGAPEANAHLTRFDTVHGRFSSEVVLEENHLVVD